MGYPIVHFRAVLSTEFKLRTSVVLAALAVPACVADSPEINTGSATLGDVPLVEYSAEEWDAAPSWGVGAAPTLAIGTADVDVQHQLYRVRGAVRLNDGVIAVADGGSNTVRYYDSAGRYLDMSGGAGDGPGEFRVISTLTRIGLDSLLVWDARTKRFTLLADRGATATTIPGPAIDEPFFFILSAFADGTLLGSVDSGVEVSGGGGVRQLDSEYFTLRPGEDPVRIGRLFTNEVFIDPGNGTVLSVPYGRRSAVAAGRNEFYYAPGDRYELQIHSRTGKLQRVVRVLRDAEPVTDDLMQSYIDRAADAYRNDLGQRRKVMVSLRSIPRPSALPAHGDLLVDSYGHAWLADYQSVTTEGAVWTVFDSSGGLLARVHTPAGLVIYEIGPDYILGRERDEFDVERVVTYTLDRTTAG